MDRERMIEINSLSKRFGPVVAVDDVSFSVSRGEVLGFLGPNGAGKSTTMRMLAGFLAPDAGSASICGFDVARQPIECKSRVGYLPEGAPLYGDMNPRGFLAFIAEARGYRGAARDERVERVAGMTQLQSVMDRPIDTLSKGFKRRVGLAQSLLHDPEVLILDEPTDGLDPNQKHEVRALIREMAPQKAIIISTHQLDEVSAVCSRAIIIADGRLVADDTPDGLLARSRHHNAVTLTIRTKAVKGTANELAKLAGVDKVETDAGDDGVSGFTIFPKGSEPVVDAVGALARDKGWEVREIGVERGRLDDVFRSLTLPG
jgi:ABC-2 type transport system ATP-binding protein